MLPARIAWRRRSSVSCMHSGSQGRSAHGSGIRPCGSGPAAVQPYDAEARLSAASGFGEADQRAGVVAVETEVVVKAAGGRFEMERSTFRRGVPRRAQGAAGSGGDVVALDEEGNHGQAHGDVL